MECPPHFPYSRKGRFPPQGRGAHSFLEKNPPHTPEEKHQGVSTSPWTPNDTKGEGCGPLPLETLSRGRGTEVRPPPLETPPGVGRGSGSGKKGRGRPVWNIGVRRTFWCGDTVLGGIGIAQPVGDFWIWSAVCDGQPPVLGELTALPGNSSLSAFSFVPCPARFLFGKTKRKCGGHSARQSRAFPCRIAAPWFIPAAIRRTFWVLPFRENHSKEPCNGQT